jgi:teichuronic acid biosynthesis glycosyltransferase TuaC
LRPRILSFTTVFPRPGDESHGLFVRARLLAAAQFADIHVLNPVPVLEYGNPAQTITPLRDVPLLRSDGPLTVHHPRWFYPPLFNAFNPIWLNLFARGPARRLHASFPFQLIDAHWGHPEGGAAFRLARALRLPFTITLRGGEIDHAHHPARRRALALAFQHAARIIAVAQPLADLAASLGANPARIRVIPNGLDAFTFHPRPRAEARALLGMDPAALHLLSAGHLTELKGHHRLVEALALLHAQGIPAHLWIAGGPGRTADFSPIIRQTAQNARLTPFVHFLGVLPPDALASAMSAADLFCLASSREGWPNVVNEALACGAPVAATRVGAVPEILSSPDFGVIVENNQPALLAAGILQALSRSWDRDAIARHGQSRDWTQTARDVTALWLESIQEAAG